MIAWLFFKELNVKYPVKLDGQPQQEGKQEAIGGIMDTVLVPKEGKV